MHNCYHQPHDPQKSVLMGKNSESCSRLPPDISHLKTDMSFLVSYSTGVSVSCSEDRELRGYKVITCNQGTDFKFQSKTKCHDIGMCTDSLHILFKAIHLDNCFDSAYEGSR